MSRSAKRGSSPGSFESQIDLLHHIKLTWGLLRDPRVHFLIKVIPPLTLVYIISPIDLVPDAILGLGQLDDMAIFLLGLKMVHDLSPGDVVQEYSSKLRGAQKPDSAHMTVRHTMRPRKRRYEMDVEDGELVEVEDHAERPSRVNAEQREFIEIESREVRPPFTASCWQNFLLIGLAVLALIGLSSIIWVVMDHVRPLPPIQTSATPSGRSVIANIRVVSRLETIHYSVQQVLEEINDYGLIGRERLLLVVYGEVIAGLDLGKLKDDDITISADKTVTLRLPPAQILHSRLDTTRTHVYDCQRSTPLVPNTCMEQMSKGQKRAEQEIPEAAIGDGILEKAETNGKAYLQVLLKQLGFSDVTFITPTPTPTETPVPTMASTLTTVPAPSVAAPTPTMDVAPTATAASSAPSAATVTPGTTPGATP